VATVPPTVALTADTFGKRNLGVVYGWIFASHQLGAATAAFGAGAIRTWFGDYQLAFMTSGVLCLLAAGIVVRINRAGAGQPATPPVPAPSY
jgi:MFS family permease